MFITSVELREIRLPLVHFFETSFGRTTERRIVLVRVKDKDGAEGWGECTAGEGPFYCEEWTETAWTTLNSFLAPMVVGRELQNAAESATLMRPVRGHRMAKAAIETACWDLEAKCAGLPLWKHLGGNRPEIPCGVSIGIQDTPAALMQKIEKELAAGYQRIKIKIKPGWDVDIVEAVRQRFPAIALMADANSAYTLADVSLFQELDRYNLMMIEQPLAHDDIFDHGELQKQIQTPICLDESIHSDEDAKHAIALGACRVINVKLGRVGGHAEAKRVERICRENNIPVWCGGMLEAGIGRAHNIAMATLAGFSLPGDVSASARYWEEDIIEPPVTVTSWGTIVAPEKPGLGFEIHLPRLEALTVRKEVIDQGLGLRCAPAGH
ncbi:MAG TPA: o-succinylbenzoate synthase [Blastocatellia bacterium]|nr:o-succinylbenzoate synthase [Blastocatellia bacterium]HAF25016.1 o-succinylbenzoate synthase [Blastocatellia bacterium]